MAIYAVIEEHSLGSSDYKYYNKLENAKKELVDTLITLQSI